MSSFVTNPTDFSAECALEHGQCSVARENILFLDDENEPVAIAHLQQNCGHVVIIPDASNKDRALLYHNSCQRMTDVIRQIFADSLQAPASLPQHFSEITVGELQRRCVTIAYDACKRKVEEFSF